MMIAIVSFGSAWSIYQKCLARKAVEIYLATPHLLYHPHLIEVFRPLLCHPQNIKFGLNHPQRNATFIDKVDYTTPKDFNEETLFLCYSVYVCTSRYTMAPPPKLLCKKHLRLRRRCFLYIVRLHHPKGMMMSYYRANLYMYVLLAI